MRVTSSSARWNKASLQQRKSWRNGRLPGSEQRHAKQAEQVRTFAAKRLWRVDRQPRRHLDCGSHHREAAGIPIIFVNRRPDDSVLVAGKNAYVGSQEYDAGKMQAEFLAKYFTGRTDPINYVLFMGQLGLERNSAPTPSRPNSPALASRSIQSV